VLTIKLPFHQNGNRVMSKRNIIILLAHLIHSLTLHATSLIKLCTHMPKGSPTRPITVGWQGQSTPDVSQK